MDPKNDDIGIAFAEQFATGATFQEAMVHVRRKFSLTEEEALTKIRQARLPSFRDIPAIYSYQELVNFIRTDCFTRHRDYFWGDPSAAVDLFFRVLRCAGAISETFTTGDHQAYNKAYDHMRDVLCFDRCPGMAAWFLAMLCDRDLIEYYGSDVGHKLTPRGRQLLEWVECWYPPDAVSKKERKERKRRRDRALPGHDL